jgi:hypothetical protein
MKMKLTVSVCCAMFVAVTAAAVCWKVYTVTCVTAGNPYQSGPSHTCDGQQYFEWSLSSNTTLTGSDCFDYQNTGFWECSPGTMAYTGVWCTRVTRTCVEHLGIIAIPTQEQNTITCTKGTGVGVENCNLGG